MTVTPFVFDPSFEVVLDRAAKGNSLAFEQLFQSASARVSSFARLRGAEDPDGLANEVFLKVYGSLRTFRGGEAQFYGWVFTIARNALIDERRKSDRRPRLVLVGDDAPDRVSSTNTEAAAIDSYDTELLVERLNELTPDQRDVLLLRLVCDLTIDSIATALDKPPGAVKALQRRALRALAENLSNDGVPL